MNKKIPLIVLSLFLSFQNFTFSQKTWTLNDCIDYAYKNNISIKRQELQTQIQGTAIKENKNALLPDLRFDATADISFARTTNLYTESSKENYNKSNYYQLSSSVVLFNGLRNYRQIEQAQINFTTSLQDLESIKDDIKLNILTAYLQILLFEEELITAVNQIKITNLQLENAKLAIDAKIIAKNDILEIESQLAYENYTIILTKSKLKNAKLQLLKILELTVEQIDIEKPNIIINEDDFNLPSFEQVYEQAQSLSRIKSAEFQVKSTELDNKIVQTLLYPEISLKVATNTNISDIAFLYDTDKIIETNGITSYDTKTFPYHKQFRHNIVPSITLGLSYPLFNKFSYSTSKEKAKIKLYDTEFFLQEQKNALYFEIKQVYADLESAISKYESSKKYLVTVQNSFDNSEIKFSAGRITSYDYNLAKNNLIKAEIELLKAKYEIIFKWNILNYY